MSANRSQNRVAMVGGGSLDLPPRDPEDQQPGDNRVTGGNLSSILSGRPTPAHVEEIFATPNGHRPAAPEDTKTRVARIPHWKRVLDLACIFLTFPLWFAVMAFVSFWILFVSPGPLLFRQERIGYRGRRFMILKFRTMKINAETQVHEGYFERLIQTDCPMTKLDVRGDQRLIRGGRFLRALGLDELPQIFNVVRGEMSFVGPRPCTPHEFARYQPAQRARVNAPPGLTGFWQVNGKNKTTFSQMIEMDLYYAKNMSLKMDLAIMLRTLPAIAVQVLESRTVRSKGSRIKTIVSEYFAQLRRKASQRKTN